MVLYQICVFGADLKSNMAARVHNVFSLAHDIVEILLKVALNTINQSKSNIITYCGVYLS
jgi:hypothetical protein